MCNQIDDPAEVWNTNFCHIFFFYIILLLRIFLHMQVTRKTSITAIGIASELVEIVQQNVFETKTLTLEYDVDDGNNSDKHLMGGTPLA
jgi:hypothetical protein